MNTTLFQIVIAVISDLNDRNFHQGVELKEQDKVIKDLANTIKLVFAQDKCAQVEQELFRCAQECRNGLNEQCFTWAMELLTEYMG